MKSVDILRPVQLPAAKRPTPCAELPTEIFFPHESLETREARKLAPICARCPLLEECLAFALENDEFGIWAGTSTATRKKMRANLGLVKGQTRTHLARQAVVEELTAQGCTVEQISAQTGLEAQYVHRAHERRRTA